jgi:hypothetical protein
MVVVRAKYLILVLVFGLPPSPAWSQGGQSQPLNSTVSNFGTTFVFSPPPVCQGCVQTELGLTLLEGGGRFLPGTVTLAPFSTSTDFSILVNLLDSQVSNDKRATHFGNRFDFVLRQRIFQGRGFLVTLAPRGVLFTRDLEGGRIGGTVAAQYGSGKNLAVVNFTYTGAIGSGANPANNYQGSFDYWRTLSEKGFAFFAGLQHEYLTENPQSIGTEMGIVLPFRNGQLELASQQLNLNTSPVWQFQARVTVNWGNLFRRK